MRAMILAAGFGERLRPLTEATPKPLLKVGNKPLIQYHIENLAAAGVRELVINTSWLGDQIEDFLGDGSHFGVEIAWSREREPLETGGGICRALPLLGREPFLLINGDVWMDYPLVELVNRVWSENIDAHLVLVPNPAHHLDGDYALKAAQGDIVVGGFGEKQGVSCPKLAYPTEGKQAFTFSGLSVMRPEIFAMYSSVGEKFPLRDVLKSSINTGAVSGELFHGEWWDIGTLERLQALNALLLGNKANTIETGPS